MESVIEIYQDDHKGQIQVNQLLTQGNICRDENLDYTCGIYDEDGELIATGSCAGPTLRCLTVSKAHQGEGLLNLIVSHLIEVQAQRGNFHLFVYTKAATAKFFQDLGFFPIAKVEGLVFMENRQGGFLRYCKKLERTEAAPAAAIVMNANPFTLGHRYLLERAAEENAAVHLFLLSEEAGPIPFAVRKKLVKEGIADLDNVVLHESGPYLISSATFPSYFLKSPDRVVRAHAALDLALFQSIAETLGISSRYAGEEPFSHTTGIYNQTMARELPKRGIDFRQIPRLEVNGKAVSASAVRQAIHDNVLDTVRDMLPEHVYRFFAGPEGAAVRAAIRTQQDVIHH